MPTSPNADRSLSRTPSPRKRVSKSGASKGATAAATSGIVPEAVAPPPYNLRARQDRIAEAAYYRAERRAFSPGFELVDWLAAEAEIDAHPGGE
jgi:hypothetical protein